MGGPGRGGDQIPIHVRRIHVNFHVPAAGAIHVRPHGRIGGATPPFQDTGRRQDLGAVPALVLTAVRGCAKLTSEMRFVPILLISLCLWVYPPSAANAQDAGDLLHRAVSLVRASRPGEAEEILKTVIAREPNHADARLLLGFLYLQRAESRQAENAFRTALAIRPDDAAARLGLGFSLMQLGLPQSASAEFERVAGDASLEAKARAAHVRSLFMSGRDQEAFETASSLCASHPFSPEYHAVLAFLCQARGDSANALRSYLSAARLDPRNLSLRFALVSMYRERQQWQLMLDETERALELDRNHPLLYESKAQALEKLHRAAEAEAARAMARRTYESEILFGRAASAHSHGRKGEAAELLRQSVRINPSLGKAWYRLGEVLGQDGRFDEARNAFLMALEAEPGLTAARAGLAASLHADGRISDALREYQRSLARGQLSPDLLAGMAAAYLDEGRIREAAAAMLRATHELPHDPDLLAYLAYLQDEEGRHQEAAQAYAEALRVEPGHVEALIGAARQQLREGNTGGAAHTIRRALERDPQRHDAWYLLAQTHLRAGENAFAEKACRDCIRHTRDHSGCRELLASIRMGAGDFTESIQHFQALLRGGIASKAILDGLGYSLMKVGRYPEAAVLLRSSLERYGPDAWVYSNLGYVQRCRNELVSAIECYREAWKLSPQDAERSHDLAYALYLNREYEAAIGPFQEAVRLRPDWGLAHYNLSLAYWHLHLYAQALIHARRAQEAGMIEATTVVAALSSNLYLGRPITVTILRPKR
ncbi:MAG: tetratricopeptide repeat protein [Acidobacteria bacterium]|nr:tetratricopeptide repeat protein [Acidobacteriota bacterium]